MASAMGILSGLLLFVLAAKTASAETCSYYNSLYENEYMECDNGCCGDYDDRYCCVWGAGSIAGTVVGLVVLVTIFIIIVVCCRRRQLATRIVYTQQVNSGISVVSTSQTTQVAGYAQPPPYPGQPQYPPPAQY